MLADPLVNHFFSGTDMPKQASRQKQFLSVVTGGPNIYEGSDMKKAHSKFKIGKVEFDTTWHHLNQSLVDLSVPTELVEQVKEIFYSVEGDVVNYQPEKKSLFDRLGGEGAINAVVGKFY
jgi:hemoglobin